MRACDSSDRAHQRPHNIACAHRRQNGGRAACRGVPRARSKKGLRTQWTMVNRFAKCRDSHSGGMHCMLTIREPRKHYRAPGCMLMCIAAPCTRLTAHRCMAFKGVYQIAALCTACGHAAALGWAYHDLCTLLRNSCAKCAGAGRPEAAPCRPGVDICVQAAASAIPGPTHPPIRRNAMQLM